MVYKLKVSFRYCEILGFNWDMVDSITKVNTDEELDILDKLVEHTESTGITWDQEEVFPDGTVHVRRTFIKIPDKIFVVEDTPFNKTVYIQIDNIPDILEEAIVNGKARYEA